MTVEAARILVVEDNRDTSILLRDLLVAEGYEVESVPTGEAALVALERTPALVLLDLMLPGLSGWEVARRLRHDPRTSGVPIIAVSALARSQERESALHAGCDAYVAKPFTPDELARLMATTLETQDVGAR